MTTLSPMLLPEDQQLVTLDLDGRRLLGRVTASDTGGRATIIVFDVDERARAIFDRGDELGIEYVRVGLCRTTFVPSRVEEGGVTRAPLVVLHGRLGPIESVQRRENFRVRLALPVDVTLLKGSPDRPAIEAHAWRGRTVNASAEGFCIELKEALFRGDVLSLKLHSESRSLEADARVIGPRPVSEPNAHRQYGLQIIQMPRADQQQLAALIRREEQRGLAYRISK